MLEEKGFVKRNEVDRKSLYEYLQRQYEDIKEQKNSKN